MNNYFSSIAKSLVAQTLTAAQLLLDYEKTYLSNRPHNHSRIAQSKATRNINTVPRSRAINVNRSTSGNDLCLTTNNSRGESNRPLLKSPTPHIRYANCLGFQFRCLFRYSSYQFIPRRVRSLSFQLPRTLSSEYFGICLSLPLPDTCIVFYLLYLKDCQIGWRDCLSLHRLPPIKNVWPVWKRILCCRLPHVCKSSGGIGHNKGAKHLKFPFKILFIPVNCPPPNNSDKTQWILKTPFRIIDRFTSPVNFNEEQGGFCLLFQARTRRPVYGKLGVFLEYHRHYREDIFWHTPLLFSPQHIQG